MEKFDLSEFELMAQYLHYYKVLTEDYSNVKSKIDDIVQRCYGGYDNIIEEVFCKYILCTTATEVFQLCSVRFYTVDEVTEKIIFKQSENASINLLAKVKCYKYGRLNDNRKDFLKWQIDKILLNGKIDMLEEYKKYKEVQGIRNYPIPYIITENLK